MVASLDIWMDYSVEYSAVRKDELVSNLAETMAF
jgi:hypothetical protein